MGLSIPSVVFFIWVCGSDLLWRCWMYIWVVLDVEDQTWKTCCLLVCSYITWWNGWAVFFKMHRRSAGTQVLDHFSIDGSDNCQPVVGRDLPGPVWTDEIRLRAQGPRHPLLHFFQSSIPSSCCPLTCPFSFWRTGLRDASRTRINCMTSSSMPS